MPKPRIPKLPLPDGPGFLHTSHPFHSWSYRDLLRIVRYLPTRSTEAYAVYGFLAAMGRPGDGVLFEVRLRQALKRQYKPPLRPRPAAAL